MIKKIDVNDIPSRSIPYNTVQKEVLRFWESGWDACEVDTKGYRDAASALGSYGNAIRRLRVGVKAITREGRCFLVRVADNDA